MNVINFIVSYWDSILIVLAAATALVLLWVRGQKNIVYKILYSLVTEAEKQFGSGPGELKLSYVINKVYNSLPGVLRAFISAERLALWVDEVLATAKEKWAVNANVNGYIGGEKE